MLNLSYSPSSRVDVRRERCRGLSARRREFPNTHHRHHRVMRAWPVRQAIGLNSAPSFYAPDTDWSYEVGENSLIRQQAHCEFRRFLHPLVEGADAGGPLLRTRLHDQRIRRLGEGGEIELQAQLAQGLTLSQTFGYADAAYTNTFAAAAVVKGEPLFDAPRWTISTGLSDQHPIGTYALVGQVQNSCQSHSFDPPYQINRVPSRDLTNLRLGLETKKWAVNAFVNNLLNVHAVLENLNLLTATGPSYNRVATNRPLTAGVELSVNF